MSDFFRIGAAPSLRDLSDRAIEFVRAAFGVNAARPDERAARVVEEACELAQSEGVSREMALRILERVYSRPVGDSKQEAGTVLLTLLSWAGATGNDLEDLARTEFARLETKPLQFWASRHQAKVREGIATSSEG